MRDDLTIIYVSASELPGRWMEFQLSHLKKAAQGCPIISITRKFLDLGINILDNRKKCYWNIYTSLLIGARNAETKYVAMAEDDTLYHWRHFWKFRPKDDEVSYNRSRWSLFTWDPIYCLRQRISNCSLIAPREYLIDALEEREKQWPDGAPDEITGEVGRKVVDVKLKVKRRKMVEWYSKVPIIQLNHCNGTDLRQVDKWKAHGEIKATDIPYWGKSIKIRSYFDGE